MSEIIQKRRIQEYKSLKKSKNVPEHEQKWKFNKIWSETKTFVNQREI